MKTLLLLSALLAFLPPEKQEQKSEFDHSGVQKGDIIWNCYDGCSALKVMDFRQLQQSPGQSIIEILYLIGRAELEDVESIKWTGEAYRTVIICSKEVPMVALEGSSTRLELYPELEGFSIDDLYSQTSLNNI